LLPQLLLVLLRLLLLLFVRLPMMLLPAAMARGAGPGDFWKP
jgi:hypothetical protein